MPSRCICPDTGLGHPECGVHGLKPGQRFPPMDRHALPGEDARMAQERLYRESLGLPPRRTCVVCRREGTRQFENVDGRKGGFRCSNGDACIRRMKRLHLIGTELTAAIVNHRRPSAKLMDALGL